jgi:hypothetical protein
MVALGLLGLALDQLWALRRGMHAETGGGGSPHTGSLNGGHLWRLGTPARARDDPGRRPARSETGQWYWC